MKPKGNQSALKPKGLVNKRITKTCPECNKQMPTACKSCSCGFVFKRNTPTCISPPQLDNLTRRRTGRVKKEPNYFNTMEYDHQFKRQRRSSSTPEEVVKKKKGKHKGTPPTKPKEVKGIMPPRLLDIPAVPSSSGENPQQKEEKPQEDLHATISNEKAVQYAIILAEINRKFLGQSFSPS